MVEINQPGLDSSTFCRMASPARRPNHHPPMWVCLCQTRSAPCAPAARGASPNLPEREGWRLRFWLESGCCKPPSPQLQQDQLIFFPSYEGVGEVVSFGFCFPLPSGVGDCDGGDGQFCVYAWSSLTAKLLFIYSYYYTFFVNSNFQFFIHYKNKSFTKNFANTKTHFSYFNNIVNIYLPCRNRNRCVN